MSRFWKGLSRVEEFVLIVGMTIMVLLNFANVVFRVALPQSPFSYSEELTIILFMWVSMFGISYGYRVYAHTVLDVLTNMMPKKSQPFIIIFATLCSMLFMGIMIYTSYNTMANQIRFGQVTPGMRLPMAVNSGALFLGSMITFLSVIRSGYTQLMEHKRDTKEVLR